MRFMSKVASCAKRVLSSASGQYLKKFWLRITTPKRARDSPSSILRRKSSPRRICSVSYQT
jgi:hypothetical protein